MKKLFYAAATAAAVAAMTPAAHATTYVCDSSPLCDFTEADTTGSYKGPKYAAGASFTDYFSFTVNSAYDAVISLTASSGLGAFNFSALELRTSDTGPYAVLGTFGPNGISDALELFLDAGTYFVYIAGTNNATKALSYTGTIDIAAPVPEPATWAMMLAGVAAVGTAMRRRSNRTVVSFS